MVAAVSQIDGEAWVRTYLPEAVIATIRDGGLHAALCYIAASRTGEAPFENYLDHIIEPARRLDFPAWYIERLERLRNE